MKKRISLLLGLFLLFTIPQAVVAKAAKSTEGKSTGDYGVSIQVPANQLNKVITTYYDLTVQPQQTGKLKFKVSNEADQKRTFKLAINQAATSDAGAIDYTATKQKYDSTLPFKMKDYFKLSANKVTVPANSSQLVTINYTIPKTSFTGIILGGLNVSKVEQKQEQAKKTGIHNTYTYAVAIVLHETQAKLQSKLNLVGVKPRTTNAQPVIGITIQNPVSEIQSKLVLKSTITKDGAKFIENTSNEMSVAPNTRFTYDLNLDNQRMKSGTYQAHIEADSKKGHWEWDQTFNITEGKANEVNRNSVFATPDKPWYIRYAIYLVIIGLLLILILILLLKRHKRDEQDQITKPEDQETGDQDGKQ
ncbi:DUF916 and DUF3324 domain-containing protein [Lapidilactobacillus bayanensis]|uniref:DUF916 and DUF3324 domain-containing protein n=1 Tax=Lapidilactobacillus bayanensis TaxID=2485998 RepID=UPI000F7A8422|nr:DUF916 and DUF3324 domain-containing protein [Lapidilactobacillus bayanensis]